MSFLHKLLSKFKATAIKDSMRFWGELHRLITKRAAREQVAEKRQALSEEQGGGPPPPDIKTGQKVEIMKAVLAQGRQAVQ